MNNYSFFKLFIPSCILALAVYLFVKKHSETSLSMIIKAIREEIV